MKSRDRDLCEGISLLSPKTGIVVPSFRCSENFNYFSLGLLFMMNNIHVLYRSYVYSLMNKDKYIKK